MNLNDAHSYWRDPETDKYGVAQAYRKICKPDYYLNLKPVSDMWVEVFEKFVSRDKSILELGCSVGRNLFYLRQNGYKHIKGIEINPHAQELAADSFGEEIADYITISSIEDYLSTPHSFDVVFTSGVLMHIHPDSEWIFSGMAKTAQEYLMCSEVEETEGFYKWPRNYRKIFEGLGFQQVHEQIATPQSARTILRVFRKG